MKIEIEVNIGEYTEQEATVRISSFIRGELNRIRQAQKVIGIPELDESPELATKFMNEFLTTYVNNALRKGAEIYASVQGRIAGKLEAEQKLK